VVNLALNAHAKPYMFGCVKACVPKLVFVPTEQCFPTWRPVWFCLSFYSVIPTVVIKEVIVIARNGNDLPLALGRAYM